MHVEGIIHIVIFYKKEIRNFLRYFREKYFKIKQFKDNFVIEKDFKISIKEGHSLELELKGRNQSILTISKNYALPLYNNAIQAKL